MMPPIPVPFGIENPSDSDAVLRIQFVGDPDGAYNEIVGATWLKIMPRWVNVSPASKLMVFALMVK